MTTHRVDYGRYLDSSAWEVRRRNAILAAGRRCQRCRVMESKGAPLEVHHLTYARLGAELPADLVALCATCHAKADDERRAQTIRRRNWARLNGWATKVWGPDWEDSHDYDDAWDLFTCWLERRGERDEAADS